MDTTTKAPARICYNSLTDYNQGELVFKWFDLDGVTYKEHADELAQWLKDLTDNAADGHDQRVEFRCAQLGKRAHCAARDSRAPALNAHAAARRGTRK